MGPCSLSVYNMRNKWIKSFSKQPALYKKNNHSKIAETVYGKWRSNSFSLEQVNLKLVCSKIAEQIGLERVCHRPKPLNAGDDDNRFSLVQVHLTRLCSKMTKQFNMGLEESSQENSRPSQVMMLPLQSIKTFHFPRLKKTNRHYRLCLT
jgi:hypothetical protein